MIKALKKGMRLYSHLWLSFLFLACSFLSAYSSSCANHCLYKGAALPAPQYALADSIGSGRLGTLLLVARSFTRLEAIATRGGGHRY